MKRPAKISSAITAPTTISVRAIRRRSSSAITPPMGLAAETSGEESDADAEQSVVPTSR